MLKELQFDRMSFSSVALFHNVKPVDFLTGYWMDKLYNYSTYVDWYLIEHSPLGQALK